MARYSLNLDPGTVRDIKELKAERGDLSRVIADHIAQQKYIVRGVIDSVPADNGKNEVRGYWIPFFNKRRKVFASAPDIVRTVYSTESLLKSLIVDFNNEWLVTSTRLSHNYGNLSATIIHYFGSKIREPVVHSRIIVPVLEEESLYEVRDNKQVLAYLKVLTGLRGKALIDGLERLSDMSAEKIILTTPSQNSRKNCSERVASFGYNDGKFCIDGGEFGDISGRARRVLDVLEQTAQKKDRINNVLQKSA